MKEDQILANGKLETPQIAKEQQIIYLDFDGADTIYQNSALDLNISVNVKDSGLSQERIDEITNELNRQYADDNVLFVSALPADEEYSTVYIGATESFKPYGEFYGLAETIDTDNQIKDDNAFVLLDQNYSDLSIISVIAHETDHIVKGASHIVEYGDLYDYATSYNITQRTNWLGTISVPSSFSGTIKSGLGSSETYNMYFSVSSSGTYTFSSYGASGISISIKAYEGQPNVEIFSCGESISYYLTAGKTYLLSAYHYNFYQLDGGSGRFNITISGNGSSSPSNPRLTEYRPHL